MITATINERETVIDVLSAAFDQNKSVNYIVEQDDRRLERIRALMAYSFDVCQLFGEVWLSDDRQACLLYLYPDRKRTTLRSVWLDIRLIFQAIGLPGIFKALRREKLIGEKQLKDNSVYLWFIGVLPVSQGQTQGTALLKELLSKAKAESRTITIETSTERNLPWYRSLGFETYDELDLSYRLYFLKNELQ